MYSKTKFKRLHTHARTQLFFCKVRIRNSLRSNKYTHTAGLRGYVQFNKHTHTHTHVQGHIQEVENLFDEATIKAIIKKANPQSAAGPSACLLYTSDAADE